MEEERFQNDHNEEAVAEPSSPEENAIDDGADKNAQKGGGKKSSDVGIFVFLGVMALLMLAAIAFVIYICSGQATGCTCGQCS